MISVDHRHGVSFFFALAFSASLHAQVGSAPERLRALGVDEAEGSVRVFFVPSGKERALRLQRSIQTSHAWFEKQLGVRVPIVLAILDDERYRKLYDLISTREIPTPENPRLIAMLVGRTGSAPPGADQDHASGGILYNEHVLFHEDGHAFFDSLQLGDIGIAAERPRGSFEAYNRTLSSLLRASSMWHISVLNVRTSSSSWRIDAPEKLAFRAMQRSTITNT